MRESRTLDPSFTWRDCHDLIGSIMLDRALRQRILLTAGVAVAALRHGTLPRWLGWSSVVTAVLLPLAIGFVGFLVFLLWVLLVSGVLAFRPSDRAPG
jgi:hypothetical protein